MKVADRQTEIVSEAEWLVARKDLLTREKDFSRQRDALSAARRELPMVKVEKEYIFDGPDGKETLADLFEGRSQLIVYHFMFGPGWEEGCKSCSYLADHFDGANRHLPHRNVTLVVVSRAPLSEFAPYKKRMGWRFKWVSSHGSDFNFDYHVSFTKEEEKKNKVYYNYTMGEFMSDELPGLSVFSKTKMVTSFTLIRLTRAGSTRSSVLIISLIWCRKGVTKTRIQPCPGFAGTINMRPD